MLFTNVLAILASASSVTAQGSVTVSASKTDIGAMLKSMDQSKLAQFPKDARAVTVKMPENPEQVTATDRAAIKACMANADLDALTKNANDQLAAVIDKQRMTPDSMAKFVTSALAAGAKPPPAA